MFEKLYGTHSGGTTRMCSIQFLEHDPHISAYNVSEYLCVKKLNKMNFVHMHL